MTADAAAERILQQRLAEAAREAGQTRARLQDYHVLLKSLCVQVGEVVGGSAQRIDRDLIEHVQDAEFRIRTAVGLLTQASVSASGSRW